MSEHEHPLRVQELEHQVGAELDRDHLIERGLDHLDRGVRRELDVEQLLDQVRREGRVLAEHLDDAVVLEAGMRATLPATGLAIKFWSENGRVEMAALPPVRPIFLSLIGAGRSDLFGPVSRLWAIGCNRWRGRLI